MTNKKYSQLDHYIERGVQAGLSAKASAVYTTLLNAGTPLSPKKIIGLTKLHRQYVYNALHELTHRRLVVMDGSRKSVKYIATTPDRLLQEVEKKRSDTLEAISSLMNLYKKSPPGMVEIISGGEACVEHEFKLLREAKKGDYLDIIGGAGMGFVNLFSGRIKEWEALRKERDITLRYIGGKEDVQHNKEKSIIKNQSKTIEGIENIVNVAIRPGSVSFNIYEPEIMTVQVHNQSASISQRALFEVLWKIGQ